ncbi:Thiamine pyrophosphate-requiring enzyme [Saccharolobus shibatae B12]|uniref:Thiamine pyrophosphate-requiring enzyme n=1 Tax=Saccharolobus shibatae (strain ATCC 51178 / DSM 5389 / JCM 8931 / NBRC 15437 / B12) TaxID=523848 RepID=A0A8F5BPY7_SACSH|nr:thiamine pyrophosphate-binding protein [Saccharolobus shibatae]QXJ29153.1 Thiamine pyrophosphate-requiring enzyme [Saccharolobus shibatae B12]
MNGSRLLLSLLKDYDIEHIFGLPGESSISLYDQLKEGEIRHIVTRDERNAVYMADAYAKLTYKPGVVEGPSVGSVYMLPGVAEAYKSSTPLIVITTDAPLYGEKENYLTALDQTSLFRPITKETITIYNIQELPHAIRRAFRLSTSGKPGPVHLRIPLDILEGELEGNVELKAQKEFSKYPAQRPLADKEMIKKAVNLILRSEIPVIICGQGVLYSMAWDAVIELAELLGIPVGTTITGKGCIPETHTLSIGVVGGRGGTSFSNSIVDKSDLIILVGSNTDSANTYNWTIPSRGKTIIHIDISEAEVGNNYDSINLIGDAKATLREIINEIKSNEKINKKNIVLDGNVFEQRLSEEKREVVNPLRFIKELWNLSPEDAVLIADPGVGAIYTAAFYKAKRAGRYFVFNYGVGGLGYSIPASVGANFARPNSLIFSLSGDGSFGFSAGELETIRRVNANVVIILFNNGSYGWIRAEMRARGKDIVGTDFSSPDYVKIAEGYGLSAYKITNDEEISDTLKRAIKNTPSLVEVIVEPEDKFVPPVMPWSKRFL